jgi:hypothetical protein
LHYQKDLAIAIAANLAIDTILEIAGNLAIAAILAISRQQEKQDPTVQQFLLRKCIELCLFKTTHRYFKILCTANLL